MTAREKAVASYAIYECLRNEQEKTDYSVANELGFSPSTLSDWKAGLYTPKLDKLAAIANMFNVPIEKFIV